MLLAIFRDFLSVSAQWCTSLATLLLHSGRLFHALQSSIDAEGFRSLRENEPVEFFVEESEDGRTKAVNVTGPDGAPPQVIAEKCIAVSSK